MAPSQLQAAPTPQKCDGSKDKKTKQTSVLDFAIWDDMAKAVYYERTLKRATKSVSGKSARTR